jgi:UDP-N-acetylmuramoyl-tripeptide--D-alanyl-D-alanine ligase
MKSFFKDLLTKIFTAQMQKIIAKYQPKIIAVVGSVGKTTTKMAIATVLKETYRVQVQEGNYNTPISVPLVFIGQAMPALYNPFAWLKAWYKGQRIIYSGYPYDVVVVELGTDTPGDIAAYGELLVADISVVTAISEEHMEHFASLKAVAKEEFAVANFSKTLVINNDDVDQKFVKEFIGEEMPIINFGLSSGDYRYSFSRSSNFALAVNLDMRGDYTITADTQIASCQLVKSMVGAMVVADLLEVNQEAIEQGVGKIKPMSGRMQLLRGIRNSTIIDDSYNSSPLAVKAALETLYEIKAPQKIAVLGMMNELGDSSAATHKTVGELCDPKQLDLVITIGQDANNYLAEAAKAKGCQVLRCKTPYEAGQILKDEIKPRALVLVKGSQNGVFAEEAIKPVLGKKNDTKLLVRQSRFWLRKKRQQFRGLAAPF